MFCGALPKRSGEQGLGIIIYKFRKAWDYHMEYGLIGGTLGHSWSRQIHAMLGDYQYELKPLTKEEFPDFMDRKDFQGINVTIPYKKDVIPYLDSMDDAARSMGAVNTIVNCEGRLRGYNTDLPGFLYMMRRTGISASGKKALILGTGGAAQAVLAALKQDGAAEIISVSRTGKGDAVTYEECGRLHRDAQLIVNTTPVGMYPDVDASPLDLAPYTCCEAVLDVVYNPVRTRLSIQAESLGMKTATGLSMLVAQAKYASELFQGCHINDDVIAPIIDKIAAML